MAYDCLAKLTEAITSDCSTQTVGGVEVDAWIFLRGDQATLTFDTSHPSKITDITNASLKKAYALKGVKALFSGGHSLITAPDRADRYLHKVGFQQFQFSAAAIENLDNANDLWFVFERKDKGTAGEGTFIAFGVKNGMFKSADDRDVNTVQGARVVTFQSPESGEPFSQYTVLKTDYATTKTLLNGLLVAGV